MSTLTAKGYRYRLTRKGVGLEPAVYYLAGAFKPRAQSRSASSLPRCQSDPIAWGGR